MDHRSYFRDGFTELAIITYRNYVRQFEFEQVNVASRFTTWVEPGNDNEFLSKEALSSAVEDFWRFLNGKCNCRNLCKLCL